MHPFTHSQTHRLLATSQSQSTLVQSHPRHPNQLPGGPAEHTLQSFPTGRCPLLPRGGSMSPPNTPSLQLLSLNVNGLRGKQKRAALFATLQSGPWQVIALQETRVHTTLTKQRLHNGVGRGQAKPPPGMAPPFGLQARQQVEVWPCCSSPAHCFQGPPQLL